MAMEVLWKTCTSGGQDDCIPAFKMPTMQPGSLHHEDIMRDGYRPRMLLYTLDELFYVYNQVQCHWGCDKKIVTSYEILSLAVVHCTECHHGIEKRGMLDALSLINVNNIHHLEHLTWAIYDGALIVGQRPALAGNLPSHTMLASLSKHIYRSHSDVAHFPLFMLASWDCKERLEVLHWEGWLDTE